MAAHNITEKSDVVKTIVNNLKSQGVFDHFRQECLSTINSYGWFESAEREVKDATSSFLSQQLWTPGLNKTQLREALRHHLHTEGYIDNNKVTLCIEDVIRQKILPLLLPGVEKAVEQVLRVKPNPLSVLRKLLEQNPTTDWEKLIIVVDSEEKKENDIAKTEEQKRKAAKQERKRRKRKLRGGTPEIIDMNIESVMKKQNNEKNDTQTIAAKDETKKEQKVNKEKRSKSSNSDRKKRDMKTEDQRLSKCRSMNKTSSHQRSSSLSLPIDPWRSKDFRNLDRRDHINLNEHRHRSCGSDLHSSRKRSRGIDRKSKYKRHRQGRSRERSKKHRSKDLDHRGSNHSKSRGHSKEKDRKFSFFRSRSRDCRSKYSRKKSCVSELPENVKRTNHKSKSVDVSDKEIELKKTEKVENNLNYSLSEKKKLIKPNGGTQENLGPYINSEIDYVSNNSKDGVTINDSNSSYALTVLNVKENLTYTDLKDNFSVLLDTPASPGEMFNSGVESEFIDNSHSKLSVVTPMTNDSQNYHSNVNKIYSKDIIEEVVTKEEGSKALTHNFLIGNVDKESCHDTNDMSSEKIQSSDLQEIYTYEKDSDHPVMKIIVSDHLIKKDETCEIETCLTNILEEDKSHSVNSAEKLVLLNKTKIGQSDKTCTDEDCYNDRSIDFSGRKLRNSKNQKMNNGKKEHPQRRNSEDNSAPIKKGTKVTESSSLSSEIIVSKKNISSIKSSGSKKNEASEKGSWKNDKKDTSESEMRTRKGQRTQGKNIKLQNKTTNVLRQTEEIPRKLINRDDSRAACQKKQTSYPETDRRRSRRRKSPEGIINKWDEKKQSSEITSSARQSRKSSYRSRCSFSPKERRYSSNRERADSKERDKNRRKSRKSYRRRSSTESKDSRSKSSGKNDENKIEKELSKITFRDVNSMNDKTDKDEVFCSDGSIITVDECFEDDQNFDSDNENKKDVEFDSPKQIVLFPEECKVVVSCEKLKKSQNVPDGSDVNQCTNFIEGRNEILEPPRSCNAKDELFLGWTEEEILGAKNKENMLESSVCKWYKNHSSSKIEVPGAAESEHSTLVPSEDLLDILMMQTMIGQEIGPGDEDTE